MSLPSWLSDRQRTTGCEHNFSIVREVDRKDLPPYVTGPIRERYCSLCGEKESLASRMAAAAPARTTPAYVPPPPPTKGQRSLPDPVPLDQIHVELDIERFGQRYDRDRRAGIKDRAINVGPDPRFNDAMAAAAEEYVARALGLPYSGSIDKPDKGWDMSFNGRRVQVKWTKYDDGKLISAPSQTMGADYYVLVTGSTTDEFRIAGWATAKELKASTTDLGYGPTYAVSQDGLRPFESLLAIRLHGA